MTFKTTPKWSAPSSLPEQISGNLTRRVESRAYNLVGIESNPGPTSKRGGIKKLRKLKPQHSGKRRHPNTDIQTSALRQLNGLKAYGLNTTLDTSSSMKAYLACLDNPFDNAPARSGVDCGLPTALCTFYRRFTQQTNSNGSYSTVVHPRISSPNLSSSSNGAPYTYVGGVDFNQTPAAQAVFSKGRVCSMGLRIRPLQPSTADQGRLSIGLLPAESITDIANMPGWGTSGTFNYGFQEFAGLPTVSTYSFKDGASVYWRPQDPNSFVFQGTLINPSSSTDALDALQSVPFFVMGLSNTAPTASFDVEMVLHMECTIVSGYTGVISAQSSPVAYPPATLLNKVKEQFGHNLNKASHSGTIGGLLGNIAKAGIGFLTGGPMGGIASIASSILSMGSSVQSTGRGKYDLAQLD